MNRMTWTHRGAGAVGLLMLAAPVSAQCDVSDLYPTPTRLEWYETSGRFQLADVDGDGVEEFVTFEDGGDRVVVRSDDETPGFEPVLTILDPLGWSELEMADVIGSAHRDLILRRPSSSYVTVFRGDGSFTFERLDPTLNLNSSVMATADLTSDGREELLLRRSSPDSIDIVTADEDDFVLVATVPIPGLLLDLTVADVNGDDTADLVMVVNGDSGREVRIAYGTGGASFDASVLVTAHNDLDDLQTNDLDGDGAEEILLLLAFEEQIAVWRHPGDGSIVEAERFDLGAQPVGMQRADFDGDGHPDLLVESEDYARVQLFRGTAGTSFVADPPTPNPLGAGWIRPRCDASGTVTDLFAFGFGVPAFWTVPVDAAGRFLGPETVPIPWRVADRVAGDFNEDGRTDLAFASRQDQVIAVHAGDGASWSERAEVIDVPEAPIRLVTADLNLDGHLDLIAATYDPTELQVRLGAGDGTFAPAQSIATGDRLLHLDVGDLDDDGIIDVAATTQFSDQVRVYRNDGSGTLSLFATFDVVNDASGVHVADLNDDGINDLLVTSAQQSDASIVLGAGRGAFQMPILDPAFSRAIASIVEDLDGDGIPDAIVGERTQVGALVLRGLGDGHFVFAQQIDVDDVRYDDIIGLRLTEIDGDGMPDLVVAMEGVGGGGLVIHAGDGSGQFDLGGALYPFGGSASLVGARDVDQDGVPDLFTVDAASGGILLARNPCDHCRPDLDDSLDVGMPDLLVLLTRWGACDEACRADLNDDGVVGLGDVTALLSAWGPCDVATP